MDLSEAYSLFERGTDLHESGNYNDAARVLQQAAQTAESQPAVTTKAERMQRRDFLLSTRDWCAMAMHEAKRYDEAVVANSRNLSVRLSSPSYGPENEDTLDTRRRLVSNYSELHQHDNAITQCREIVKASDSSEDRNLLANRLYRRNIQNDVEEAVNINYFTLDRDEKLHGKSHFPLCQARHNLGVELHTLNKYEAAMPFLQANAAILRAGLKKSSPPEYTRVLKDTEATLNSCKAQLQKKEDDKHASDMRELREKERLRKQQLENKRLEKERVEAEVLETRRLVNEHMAKERLENTKRVENQKLEVERMEKERLTKERLEQEQVERDRAETVRQERDLAEKVRVEKDQLEKARLEAQRIEEEGLEAARIEKERTEAAHVEKERTEAALIEKERIEAVRVEKERADAAIIEKKRLEEERKEAIRIEEERKESVRIEEERKEAVRLEEERVERERIEEQRIENERVEKQRIENERIDEQIAENERVEEQRIENERIENERIENERIEKERRDKEYLETERIKKENIEKARIEKERIDNERIEKAGIEKELQEERQRAEKVRIETERIEKERIDKESTEKARIEDKLQEEKEQAEKVRIEKERIEKERIKKERIEKERIEKERIDKESIEKARIERELEEERQRAAKVRLEQEKQKERLQEESRRKEQQWKRILIQRVKNAQSRRHQQLQTGDWTGSSQIPAFHELTPELEQTGDLDTLRAICSSLESQIRDWDLQFKFVNTPGAFPQQEPESHSRQETASDNPFIKLAQLDTKLNKSIKDTKTPDVSANRVRADVKHNHSTSDIPLIHLDSEPQPQLTRRSRSSETLKSNVINQLRPAYGMERSSSVRPRERPKIAREPTTVDSSVETKADLWFKNLGDTAHRILDNYNGFVFDDRGPYEKVKIAVLDTGAAQSPKSGIPEILRKSKGRIKWRKVKGNTLPLREDDDGHGTQVASIVLQVSPFAQVFIYRVVRHRTDSIQPAIVAAAIEDAIDAGVDIINLSFGWDHESGEGHDELRAALGNCSKNGVLVFAATSNNDLESEAGMAYPARDDRVIAIDAASAQGEWLPFNPSRDNDFKTHRFTALGQGIRTDFPLHLDDKEGTTRMKGTSAATPIAAGIASLILEFARQPPLGYAPEIAKLLKRPEFMREVLAGVVSVQRTKNGEYRHLVPTNLFKPGWEDGDKDDWLSSKGHRRRAVAEITKVLERRNGFEIADPMYDHIDAERVRRAVMGLKCA